MEYEVRTRSGNLNVRSGPGLQYRIVGALRTGERVRVSASQGAWRQLETGNWVHGDFLVPAGAAPPSGAGEAVVLPHYRWPTDRHRRILAGFPTGRHELGEAHKRWLLEHAVVRARRFRQWIFLRGHASRRGGARSNQDLSESRAREVRDFLVRHGVPANRITGFGGVGEQWSHGGENDNSPEWRSVEVIVSNGVIEGGTISVSGTSPLSRNFFIKYLGGGGGGPGFALSVHGFGIRSRSSYYTRYGLGAIGASIGAPISLGDALPPERGWVVFTTPNHRTVDSFGGRAYIRQSGVQAGSHGFGFFKMWIPNVFNVDVPAEGLGATIYDIAGGPFDPAAHEPWTGEGWRHW